jgi:hypothetical protein
MAAVNIYDQNILRGVEGLALVPLVPLLVFAIWRTVKNEE